MIEFINDFGRQWAMYFGFATLQNTLFLAVVLGALWVLRKARARVKYFVTLVGLLKLLLPPILPLSSASSFPPFSFFMEVIPVSANPEAGMAHAAGLLKELDLYGVLFLSWTTLSLVGLVIPILATLSLKAKLTNSEKIPAGSDATISSRRIDVYQTTKLAFPLSLGLFKSQIFMPTTYQSWPSECQTLIIHHELAHIRRRDAWIQGLQVLVRALYFFHPLVWLLNNRMEEYREMICDETAIAHAHVSPVEYSRYLVYIAEQITRENPGCAVTPALIRQKNQLLKRVAYHIKEENMRPIKKTTVVLIFGLLLALILPLSWFCGKEKPPEAKSSLAEKLEGQQNETPALIDFDKEPVIVSRVEPKYPEKALASQMEAKVIGYVFINKQGDVEQAKTIKSEFYRITGGQKINQPGPDKYGFEAAVIEAVKGWKFQPALLNGEPVEVWISIPFNFTLR